MTYSIGSSSLSLYVFSFLASIGCLVFVHISFTLFRGIYARLLRPGKNIKLVYGSWAVITGATDGIGKGMAFELARKGLNIFLISRSEEKLKQTSDELEKKYPNIQVKYLSVDYADFNDSMKEKVSEATKYLEVGVLVNNVGISYPFTKYFDELSNENVEQLIRLNVDSTTWMTRIFLPGMKSRGRGAVVNIGSAAGVSISPLLAQYGAAKSYIAMFSKALNYEMKGSGVHVQCQIPLFVATKLAKIKKTSIFTPSPSTYAKSAVAAIGFETVVSPYWSHALQIWALTTLPEFVVARIVFSMHKGIRAAGMKKEAKALEESKQKLS